MEIYKLSVNAIGKNYENDVLTLGFSEDESNDKFVSIQYQSELTKQDKELGWSKYYLELGEYNKGAYHCINSILHNGNSLSIILNESGFLDFGFNQIEMSFLNVNISDIMDDLKTIIEGSNINYSLS